MISKIISGFPNPCVFLNDSGCVILVWWRDFFYQFRFSVSVKYPSFTLYLPPPLSLSLSILSLFFYSEIFLILFNILYCHIPWLQLWQDSRVIYGTNIFRKTILTEENEKLLVCWSTISLKYVSFWWLYYLDSSTSWSHTCLDQRAIAGWKCPIFWFLANIIQQVYTLNEYTCALLI